jgi:hypothetical protein
MKLSFGIYSNMHFEEVPEEYLCWICAAWKGGVPSKHAGVKPFSPPERDFIEARRILKDRGYDTKGIWPQRVFISPDKRP